jgi:hypothetical protein
MVAWTANLKLESIVEIQAEVLAVGQPIRAATVQNVELGVLQVFLVSAPVEGLPILPEDCMRPASVLQAQQEKVCAIEEEMASVNAEVERATVAEARQALLERLETLREEKARATVFAEVSLSQRLDHRVIDLRVRIMSFGS